MVKIVMKKFKVNFKNMQKLADEKITKIGEVSGQYLNDYLLLLTYLIDKAEVDRAEDKYQENLRKAKRGI